MGLFRRSKPEPVFFDPVSQTLEDFLFGEDADSSQEDTQPIIMKFEDNVQTHWTYIPDVLGFPESMFPWAKSKPLVVGPLVEQQQIDGVRPSFVPEPPPPPLDFPDESQETFDKYLGILEHSVSDYEYFSYENPGGNHGAYEFFTGDVDELYDGSVLVERSGTSFVPVREHVESELSAEEFAREMEYIRTTDEISLQSKLFLLDLLEERVRKV